MSYVNAERNQMIVNHYYSGQTIAELSEVYFLSEKEFRELYMNMNPLYC